MDNNKETKMIIPEGMYEKATLTWEEEHPTQYITYPTKAIEKLERESNHFKIPKVYLIGYTTVDLNSLKQYLEDTDQLEFLDEIKAALDEGLDLGEILCSFYAKACYASLTNKKNKNITKTRSIYDNIKSIIESGHGSVIEHCQINFMVTNCSRVFCYAPDTEILTQTGWKNITQIQPDELLLTKNPQTGFSEWQKNIKLHKFKYTGELNWFKSSQWESPKITSDHVMWAAPHQMRKYKGKSIKEIKSFCEKISYSYLKDKPFVIDQEINFPLNNQSPILIGNNQFDSEDFFKWLGLLVTDGTISKNKNYCSIIQYKKKNFIFIRNLMNKLFKDKWKEYNIPREGKEFRIFDKELKTWIVNILHGRTKEEIRLYSLLSFSRKDLLSFYEGALLGDGNVHKNRGHEVIYCGYENLAKDWQFILAAINKSCNIRIDDRRGMTRIINGNPIINKNIGYIISVHKKSESLVKKNHHQHTIYNGDVYCPETNNGLVFVRKNGMAFWCGNTHELVRHRVGTSFSQTSGRYVRTDQLNMVYDPILDPAKDLIEETRLYLENQYKKIEEKMKISEVKDFDTKKKMTSAMRRILPNGQTNEMGVSFNLRSLRHTLETRTARHAEWEIRVIFNQIYQLVKEKYSAMFFDATEELVDGLIEVKFKNKKI